MKKKIFLDGPRAPRSTIKKKKLGLWGREWRPRGTTRVKPTSLNIFLAVVHSVFVESESSN